MAASTTKKALLRRFDREPAEGFVNPQTYLRSNGVELLSTAGEVVVAPYAEVKDLRFIRDFGVKEELEGKVFNTRPKMEGLWLRLTFRDGEVMDGVLPNNLLQLDIYGFTVIPPDHYSNNQRIFVPKAALREARVLGVVGTPLRRRKGKAPAPAQIELFE